MLTVILGALIGIGLIIRIVHKNGFDWDGEAVWLAGLAGLLGAIVGLIVAVVLGLVIPISDIPDRRIPLTAVRDSVQPSGAIYLLGGSIEGKPVLMYAAKEGAGIRIGAVEATRAGLLIYEDSTEQPYIQTYRWDTDNRWAIPVGVKRLEFHVPPNTVSAGFEVDLK